MYVPTIGLEVHAELKTNSKMFCGCKNDPHASDPNTNICPVCMGHPGTLPVPNEAAIKAVLLFGVAVGGELATYSEFDRKNYFYPDIPKAYQLSQYAFPFVKGGELAGVQLTRVHLEEDTARSQHDKGEGSLVDYNRAGVPLMELVTEPVIHDAKTAGAFARELQLMLRTIGISDANMEKGEMRVEANISVSNTGQKAKKYVEVKNLNSFRSVEQAIEYEIKRQIAVYEAGGQVAQETRGWDEAKGETYIQRSKETAKDYRYFPDPDLPKYDLSKIETLSKNSLTEILPILPDEKRSKYGFLGLPSQQIESIVTVVEVDRYFQDSLACMQADDGAEVAKLAANYLLTDFQNFVLASVDESKSLLAPKEFVALMRALVAKKITSRVAKDMLIEFGNQTIDIMAVIAERGLFAEASSATLEALVRSTLAEHPTVVSEYRAGKVSVIQFLVGQVMKVTKGSADPSMVRDLLEKELVS